MTKLKCFLLVNCLAMTVTCTSQKLKSINRVFSIESDTNVKLIINHGKFVLLDSRKDDHLGTPCCDTITFGDIELDKKDLLLLKSDPSLNSIFINMNVVENKNKGSDSIIFNINNPIEEAYRKYNPTGGDLTYKLSVEPVAKSSNYFKENNQPFEGGNVRFYNPDKAGIFDFMIVIEPKNSVYVKNLAVRELSTVTYRVKDKESNVFDINLPGLTYGFLSYTRIKGDYAKMPDRNTILWGGRRFVRIK